MSKMIITKREYKRLLKIALDHPFFDCFPPQLTDEVAEAIVAKNCKMTGKEFVDSIYAELGMERPKDTAD